MKTVEDALGLLEYSSIAAGVRAADEVLKTARVALLRASPVSPGKFLVIFGGGVAEVEASLDSGRSVAPGCILDELLLARVHPEVPPAIGRGPSALKVGEAIGIVETLTVASAIVGADAAAKAATVSVLELGAGRGIGGKGFFTLTGDVAAVQAAVEAARAPIDERGFHVRTEVLAGPHPELAARVGRMLTESTDEGGAG
ncbi:MAG: BMC domain-containing protein [Gemmatimonadota bacterium]|nr:BMC domain-containing protein [Gemmatimonadota bacterium]MDP6802120.1 BMC domain-containing protein [Gemmatimonadota bacterium]MDP7032055.1 BMC domain-containing protein [Gemmatimonadota bacterium]